MGQTLQTLKECLNRKVADRLWQHTSDIKQCMHGFIIVLAFACFVMLPGPFTDNIHVLLCGRARTAISTYVLYYESDL